MFNIVLVHPEIPPNTGNVIRLAANTGGALELLVVHRKAERFDQVQRAAGVGREPDHVAGVGRDLGVDEDDVEHVGCSNALRANRGASS